MLLKVSIGTNIQDGPWGGGNLFAVNLSRYLKNKGHDVIYNLDDRDIDIILLTEPRKTSPSSAYTNFEIQNYINYKNPNAIVIHRVNECDEHKDTSYINKYISYSNKCADATVFVSSWIKDLYSDYEGINSKLSKVILSGADSDQFNNQGFKRWNKKEKFKLVTHHWSNNWNKGFDVYKKIDDLLSENKFKNLFEFNFIGRIPDNLKFKNSNIISPKSGEELSNEIKKNDFYITGSINEPSGNHHIEAAQCGLPILYIESGGITEYCEGYGIKYTINNLEEKLYYALENCEKYYEKVENYPRNADLMSEEFLVFFNELLSNRENLINNRSKQPKSLFKKYFYNLRNK